MIIKFTIVVARIPFDHICMLHAIQVKQVKQVKQTARSLCSSLQRVMQLYQQR